MSDKDPGRDDLAGDPAARGDGSGATPARPPEPPNPETGGEPGKEPAEDTAGEPGEGAGPEPGQEPGATSEGLSTAPAGAASPVDGVPGDAKGAAFPAGEASAGGTSAAARDRADTGHEDTGHEDTGREDAGAAADEASDGGAGAASPAGGAAGGRESGAEPGKKRGRRRKAVRWSAIGLAVVLLAAGAGIAGLYYDLVGGISQQNAAGQLGADRPKKLNKSLNVLLIGSDTREGDNARYGASAGMTGARSDTAILLHLSPNRDQAVGISFPRDSMVRIPACKKKKGGTVPAQFGMLNAAFAYAGPTCTWKTLESLTGIHIDHFVQVDFTGFKRMVDALGGVEICVDRPVEDPRAELSLKAGKQTVKGDDALGYVRARYSLGDGSDLERIERQQKFMASVVDKATSGKVLADPARTYKFLKAATKSMTTDDELDLSAMRKLAEGLRGMSAGQVRFVTVPVKGYAPDPNRVQWDRERADPLFEAVRHDNDLPAEPEVPVAQRRRPAEPADVRVTVVDAGAGRKRIEAAVRQLRRRGFTVAKQVGTGPAAPESRIVFAPAAEGRASALARVLPDALLTPGGDGPADGVRLVVGRNGVRPAPPAINKITGGVKAGRNPCG